MNKWQPLPTQEGWHGVRTIGDTNELNITFERFRPARKLFTDPVSYIDAADVYAQDYNAECEFIKINTEELMKR